MKKITNWLFGYYKSSPVLQGAVVAAAILHISVLGGWWLTWLCKALPWPSK